MLLEAEIEEDFISRCPEKDHVQYHDGNNRHLDERRFERFLEARFEHELIYPNAQNEHHARNGEARIRPGFRKNTRQYGHRFPERFGAEENPRYADEMEYDDLFDESRNLSGIERSRLELAGYCAPERMERSPDDEVPCGAVPQTGHEHRNDHIAVGHEAAAAVPSQRDVEVILEPRRQADVPSLPELAQRCGEIGIVEVQHEVEAQHACASPCHIGVAAEIEVYLPRKGVCGYKKGESVERPRIVVDLVGIDGEKIGERDFLEETHDEKRQAFGDVIEPEFRKRGHLREHVLPTLDGAGEKIREE